MKHLKCVGGLCGILIFGVARLAAQSQTSTGLIETNSLPSTVHALKANGIENFYQLSERIYSGAAPEGQAAFAALAERGIRIVGDWAGSGFLVRFFLIH